MDFSTGIGYGELTLRLLLATGIGVLFGLERQKSKKPIGPRTHVLVCLAACVITLISAYGFNAVYQYYPVGINFTIDPARLVVGVLTGIGFIGAGIIWKSPTGVIGITTAAEIFLLAALGISIGMGFYFLTALATAIAILTMIADHLWQAGRKKLDRKKRNRNGSEESLSADQ
jgi:putative Mg2+ transporter-C (MgtC) family protein